MNDELSDGIKKFMLPQMIELQDHKGKVFYIARVSTTSDFTSKCAVKSVQYQCKLTPEEVRKTSESTPESTKECK